jgi:hypothetical protein
MLTLDILRKYMVQISTVTHIPAVLRRYKLERWRLSDHIQVPLHGRPLNTEQLRYGT